MASVETQTHSFLQIVEKLKENKYFDDIKKHLDSINISPNVIDDETQAEKYVTCWFHKSPAN